MLCVASLIVLSILGLFSASHRKLAREALDCVLRRATLRPCNTGFDTKIKSKILGSLITKSPKVAKFVSKRFELLSWVFITLTIVSFLWSVRGVYNFWAWGHCEGQFASGGFCVFDPTGENAKATALDGAECVDQKLAGKALSIERGDRSVFPVLWRGNSKARVLFVGCYLCDYTRRAYPTIKKVFEEAGVQVQFGHSVTKKEAEYLLPYDVCVEKLKPDAFSAYVDRLFLSSKDQVADKSYAERLILSLGIDSPDLAACLTDPETTEIVEQQQQQLRNVGIYGTPTVFINNTGLVGPKPARVYKRLL
jgi:hypothetical protein